MSIRWLNRRWGLQAEDLALSFRRNPWEEPDLRRSQGQRRPRRSREKADEPTDGEHPADRTSSADIGGQEIPIDDAERDTSKSHDVTLFRKSDEGGDTSESDDDDQLSVADACGSAAAEGELSLTY